MDKYINETAEKIMVTFQLTRSDLPKIRGILEKLVYREAKKTVRIMQGDLSDE